MPKKVVLPNYRMWRSHFKNREHHEYGREGKNDFFFQPYYTMLFWRRRNFAVDSNKNQTKFITYNVKPTVFFKYITVSNLPSLA